MLSNLSIIIIIVIVIPNIMVLLSIVALTYNHYNDRMHQLDFSYLSKICLFYQTYPHRLNVWYHTILLSSPNTHNNLYMA